MVVLIVQMQTKIGELLLNQFFPYLFQEILLFLHIIVTLYVSTFGLEVKQEYL